MNEIQELLDRKFRVELIEYELRPSRSLRLVFVAYPMTAKDADGAGRREFLFRGTREFQFAEISIPTGALASIDSECVEDGSYRFSFQFEDSARLTLTSAQPLML